MKSSGQKAGFSIAVMIGVIIAAGIAVDMWDAHQSRLISKPLEGLVTEDAALKGLVEEVERLKSANVLLNMQNDALRKQIEELNQKPVESGKPHVVKGDKPIAD